MQRSLEVNPGCYAHCAPYPATDKVDGSLIIGTFLDLSFSIAPPPPEIFLSTPLCTVLLCLMFANKKFGDMAEDGNIFKHSICQFRTKFLVKTFFWRYNFLEIPSGTASPVTLFNNF